MGPLALAGLGVLVAVIGACLVTATIAVAAGDTEDLGRVIDIDEWRAQRRG